MVSKLEEDGHLIYGSPTRNLYWANSYISWNGPASTEGAQTLMNESVETFLYFQM